MNITAHLKVGSDGVAYYASPFPEIVQEAAEEHNKQLLGPGYLSQDKAFAPVTVEFEVPDDIFKRQPLPTFSATAK